MSIFGFGTPSELTTHIGVMVKSATDSLRIGPDWTLNLQICDEVRRNRREFPDQAVRAIKRRLNDNDQQTVYLALILFEACMKNCGNDFASAVDKSAMDDMVKVAQGSRGIKNSEEALRLIATWARVYEHRKSSFPLFFDTFMHMKARGITFPKEDESAVMSYEGYERPASRRESRDAPSSAAASVAGSVESHGAPVHHGAAAAAAAPAATDPVEDEFLKLQLDLSVVMEKVNLCREILQVSPGIQHDEALADVIGFLEACRDRMVDVIEAGTQGLLGEDLFAVALKVNDAVLRTLDAERVRVVCLSLGLVPAGRLTCCFCVCDDRPERRSLWVRRTRRSPPPTTSWTCRRRLRSQRRRHPPVHSLPKICSHRCRVRKLLLRLHRRWPISIPSVRQPSRRRRSLPRPLRR